MGMFTETDAAVLYETVINKLQADVGETLYPGDERRIFAEGMVALLVVVFNTIDDTAKQNMLKYARGSILDAIGDMYDCRRLEAVKSNTTLRFSIKSSYSADITIPKGTRAETEDGHCFATNEEAVINQGSLYIDIDASSITGGAEYNNYLAGSVTIMVDLLSYVDSVTNMTITDDGTDVETDDDYRERIRLSLTKFSTAGPKNAWKYWALSADSGISDVHVENPSANEVEITIIMNDGSLPDIEMIAKVESVVTADDVKPLGDHVKVKVPTTSLYDINLVYYVSSKTESEVVSAIESETYKDTSGVEHVGAIKAYKLWQDTVIARDINPDKLRALVMNPAGDGSVQGAERVQIISPVFTELTGDVVAHFSGTINVSHQVKDTE